MILKTNDRCINVEDSPLSETQTQLEILLTIF